MQVVYSTSSPTLIQPNTSQPTLPTDTRFTQAQASEPHSHNFITLAAGPKAASSAQ